MFTRSPKHLLTCIAILGAFALTATAQSLKDKITAEADEFRKVIDHSIKTSTLEGGSLTSFRFRLPSGVERVISVEQADDRRSFTMFDNGRSIKVAVEEDGRISSIVFPNGKQALFKWVMMPNGYWVPGGVKVDGKEVSRTNISEAGDCEQLCRNAAVLSTIAIGTCIANGPLSAACWAATAAAGYATYLCYECVMPRSDLARVSNISIGRPDLLLNYEKGSKKIVEHYPGNRPDRRRCVSVRSE